MNRDEFLRMQLAGTVTFPATFPQLGRLNLRNEDVPAAANQDGLILAAIHQTLIGALSNT